ncbi:MAG: signal peptidase I [Clostridiales bacterium]|nr:signal peptidase I [Clostridiales bacterium]
MAEEKNQSSAPKKEGNARSAGRRKERESLTAARIIRKRRYDIETKKESVSLVFRLVCMVIVGWLVFTRLLLVTQAADNEMFPSVKAGDLVVAYRLQETYSKNDVVVYTAGGKRKIGRVVARATDVVNMSDSGTLQVNGTVQTGEILFSTYAKEGITYPFAVPEGCVFVLCDYRTSGTDSRDYGAISLEDVEGKVITILRRRSL